MSLNASGWASLNSIMGQLSVVNATISGTLTASGISLKGNITPSADGSDSVGTSALRYGSMSALLYTVYHASADANPTSQLGDGQLKFGAGAGSALDTTISRATIGMINVPSFRIAGGFTISDTSNTYLTYDSVGGTISFAFLNSLSGAGNLILNVPTGKQINLQVNGSTIASLTNVLFSTPDISVTNDQFASLVSNVTTTSTSGVSSGVGIGITARNGKSKIAVAISHFNNTLGDGSRVALYRNTSGVPAAGTGVGTDTQLTTDIYTQEGLASNDDNTPFIYNDSGLTNGTTYYYYIAYNAVTGGTAQLTANGATTIQGRAA